MRLIDADALLESLDKNMPRSILMQTYNREDIIRTILDAPTIDGWISVKERLPMLMESVLFTGKNYYGTWFLAQRGYYDGTFWHSNNNGTVYATTPVTHWMPLPEPPKEEVDNEY